MIKCSAVLFFSYFTIAIANFDEAMQFYQSFYDAALEKYGQDYMEGIEFTQQVYNFDAIDQEEFDFIIVGAGPAGCVLTHRLSENRNYKILLLEAGGEAPVLNDIPILIPSWNLSPLNWNYKLQKDSNFGRGLINGTMGFPRGKGLGGTTLTNFMLFTKGTKGDYDEWEKQGNKGWGWKDVKPIFERLENTQISHQDYDERGQQGILTCSEFTDRSTVTEAWVKACQKSGLNFVDFNGKTMLGTSYTQVTARNSLRLTAEKAYLRPIKKRPNLKILTRSFVTQILFDCNNVASGVSFTRDGKPYTVRVRKEVILSAGTFNSAQLLMLSGIGPKKDLKKLGINVIKDLQVGKLMYDHLTFFALLFESDYPITKVFPESVEMDKLVTNGSGNLVTGYAESMTFIQTKNANKSRLKDQPDMEYIFFPADLTIDGGLFLRPSFDISQESYDNFYSHQIGKHVFSVLPMHLHPKATGNLKLNSSNPFDPPIITYPFLNNREDVQAFIDAINQAINITKEEPLAKYGVKPVSTIIPGCEDYEFLSDNYWECGIRSLALTLHHQVGTCKMGPKNDPGAVVDNKGRVYGVENLRIADPSIIPVSISSHTQVPSYMIGEKISSEILKEYRI